MPRKKAQQKKVSKRSMEAFERVHILRSAAHSLRTLELQLKREEIEIEDAVRRKKYLRRRVLVNTALVIKEALWWGIKLFVPSFLVGEPSLWSNVKTLLTKKEFKPIRRALASWAVFAFLVGSFTVSWLSHSPGILTADVTNNWPFTTSDNYTYNSNFISVAGGLASLRSIDQTDDDNSATGFAGGTHSGTNWNGSALATASTTNDIWALPTGSVGTGWFDMADAVVQMNFDEAAGTTSGTERSDNAMTWDCSACPTFGGSSNINTGVDFDLATPGEDITIANGFSSASGSIQGDDTFTLMFWANLDVLDGLGSNGSVFVAVDQEATWWALDDNEDRFWFGSGGSNAYWNFDFSLNNWHHYAFVKTGAAAATVYIDGEEIIQSGTVGAMPATGRDMYIGGYWQNDNFDLDGTLDELILMDKTLTHEEVSNIYNRQKNLVGVEFQSRIIDAGDVVAWSSLAWTPAAPYSKQLPSSAGSEAYGSGNIDMTSNELLIHFDENPISNATTLSDDSGNSRDAVVVTDNGATDKSFPAIIDNGMTFDGTGDYATGTAFTVTSTYSMSVWFNPDVLAGYIPIFEIGATPNRVMMWLNNDEFGALGHREDGNFTITTDENLTVGNWYHAVFTFNSSSNPQANLYVNGVEATLSFDSGIGAVPNLSGSYAIGQNGTADYGVPFDGRMDDLAFWNRELSAAEALAIYNRGLDTRDICFQVRSCNDASCDGESFVGPSGLTTAFYCESGNSSASTPSFDISGDVNGNRYFQYRVIMESASSTDTPTLSDVVVGPSHYYAGNPTITNQTGVEYTDLSLFTENTGGGHAGSVGYQLSNDGASWYYYSIPSSTWKAAPSETYSYTNTAATVNTNIGDFATDIGLGSIYWQAYFNSASGTEAVVLDEISIDLTQSSTPTVQFAAPTSTGSEATVLPSFQITMSETTSTDVTVNLEIVNSSTVQSAGNFADVVLSTTSVTIPNGSTSTNALVTVIDDAWDEDSELLVLRISSVSDAAQVGSVSSTTYTITDNDDAPTVSFSSTTSSASEASSTISIPVSLSAASSRNITFFYSVKVASSTASSTDTPSDFTLATASSSISAESTTTTFNLTITDDTWDEDDETVVIEITSSTNATLGANLFYTHTIEDNDAAPSITFTAATASQSEAVTSTNAVVQLSGLSTKTVTVDYTVAGTATDGGTDYTLAAGTVTTTPGNTTTSLPFVINNDSIDEDDETIIITMSSASNGSIGTTSTHTYTISDDDDAPSAAFLADSGSGNEDAAGSVSIDLSGASGRTITVTVTMLASSTATSSDVSFATTTTFVPGDTSEQLLISPVDDSLYEANETAILQITAASNASIGVTDTYTYTINNNDTAPSVGFVSAAASGAESEANVSATVFLTEVSGFATVVTTTIGAGTATSTGDNPDFSLAAESVTIPAGSTSTSFSLTVTDDGYDENNETIILTLSTSTNSTIGATNTHTYTITDNDEPGVTASETTQAVTEGGDTDSYTLVLDAIPSNNVTIALSVDEDQEISLSSSTITFTSANWNTAQTITVTAVDDSFNDDEDNTAIISHTVTSDDGNFDGLSVSNITVTITDNDEGLLGGSGGAAPAFISAAPTAVISQILTTQVPDALSESFQQDSSEQESFTPQEQLKTLDEVLPEGKKIDIAIDTTLLIPVGGSFYVVTVLEASASDVLIGAEEKQYTLAKGKFVDIDFDGDGIEDARLRFLRLVDGKPTIEVTELIDAKQKNNSVVINNAAYHTHDRKVQISINATGMSKVAISNNSDFEGTGFKDIESSIDWELEGEYGYKVVYVRFLSTDGFVVDLQDGIWFIAKETEDPSVQEKLSEPIEETTVPESEPETETPPACALQTDTAYRYTDSPSVYYITADCTRRAFRNADIFFSFFQSWDDVVITTKAQLDAVPVDSIGYMPLGPLYKAKSGYVVKEPWKNRVYLLLNDSKYWIRTESVFVNMNLAWSYIKDVGTRFINQFREAEPIDEITRLPNYIVFRYDGDPTIYRLEPNPEDSDGQIKRAILDEGLLVSINYDVDGIITLSADQQYPSGEPLGVAAPLPNELETEPEPVPTSTPPKQTDGPINDLFAPIEGLLQEEAAPEGPFQFRNQLFEGQSGTDVEELQRLLQQLGYGGENMQITAQFSEETKQAVIQFQEAHGLPALGIVGPQTREILNSYLDQ